MPGMLAVEAGAHGAFVLDWRGVRGCLVRVSGMCVWLADVPQLL